jgi:hypothetical protein
MGSRKIGPPAVFFLGRNGERDLRQIAFSLWRQSQRLDGHAERHRRGLGLSVSARSWRTGKYGTESPCALHGLLPAAHAL